MTEVPVRQGEIPSDGVLGLLREIEDLHTTGVLRFRSGDRSGYVRLVRGQLATDQPTLDGGEDPVEVMLHLRSGTYELVQVLPPLPVSTGDGQHRRGSLEVHVAADLMNYCEQAGLTGTLSFHKDGRSACVIYDRGELVGIRVDGEQNEDLRHVFGWEEGTFEIEARALAATLDDELDLDELFEDEVDEVTADLEPTIPRVRQRRDPTGQHFLRVVEVALTDVMRERESYRPPSRSSPPIPAMSPPRAPQSRPADAQPQTPAPARSPREEREPTVKIVYHSRRGEGESPRPEPQVGSEERSMAEENERPDDDQERSASADAPAEEASEPAPAREEGETSVEAAPPLRAPAAGAETGAEKHERTSLLGTAAWIAVVALLALATVKLLALLPPLE